MKGENKDSGSFKPQGRSLQLDEKGLITTEGGATTGAAHLCVYTYGIRNSNQQLEYKAPVCGGHDFDCPLAPTSSLQAAPGPCTQLCVLNLGK